jgi:large subunit ribosomal protein L6
MSRIGKLLITVPQGVKVAVAAGNVRVEGSKGKLELAVPPRIQVKVEGQVIKVSREGEDRQTKAFHGLARKLIANMVQGVSHGFTRVLEIHGVGYRAEAKGSELHLSLGFSHPVVFSLPAGVTASVDRQTVVTLESADRQLLGLTAAKIRAIRSPEPYKGKGVRYRDEVIQRKAGKAVGAGGSA